MDDHGNALENVDRALKTDRTFPNQVFDEGWANFEFFDSDWMSSPGFIRSMQQLVAIEGSRNGVLVNLDHGDNRIEPQALWVDQATLESAFASVTSDRINWISCLVRLGAASDVGGWCAYCEPMAEIGVLAFRSAELYRQARPVLSVLHALPVARAIADPQSYAFAHAASNPEYFDRLLAEYAKGEHRDGV